MIGQRVSHYQITLQLGAGGMSEVFKARDLSCGRPVALKLFPRHLRNNPEASRRFLREAQVAAQLEHPNIYKIHETGETEDGRLYLAMEFYPGETLEQRLLRQLPSLHEAVGIVLQTTEGLAVAHGAGIVHRDLKPSNLLLTPEGIVKILDFGLARLADASRITRPGSILGSASYISPELIRGEVADPRADIWALGVILYQMISGRLPFAAGRLDQVVRAILESEPPHLMSLQPSLPPELDRLVARTLCKNREERYESAAVLRDELAALRQTLDAETLASVPGETEPPRAAGKRIVDFVRGLWKT